MKLRAVPRGFTRWFGYARLICILPF